METIEGNMQRQPLVSTICSPGHDGSLAHLLPAAMPRCLLLVDPITMTRQSLSHMLRTKAQDIDIVSVAGAGDLISSPVDLALLNIHSARVDAPKILAEIALLRQCHEGVPIMVLANHDDSTLITKAIRQELRGYMPTSLDAETAVAAVRLVLAGGTFVPGNAIVRYARAATSMFDEKGEAEPAAADGLGLTHRETDVLCRLQLGKPNKIIAHELMISESTVKVHVRSIMRKLRATNRTQVAFLAQAELSRLGLIALQPG